MCIAVAHELLLETVPPLKIKLTLAEPAARPDGVPSLDKAILQPPIDEKPLLGVPYAMSIAPFPISVAILAGVLGSPLGAFLMVPELPD